LFFEVQDALGNYNIQELHSGKRSEKKRLGSLEDEKENYSIKMKPLQFQICQIKNHAYHSSMNQVVDGSLPCLSLLFFVLAFLNA